MTAASADHATPPPPSPRREPLDRLLADVLATAARDQGKTPPEARDANVFVRLMAGLPIDGTEPKRRQRGRRKGR
jgi:hypothetical protein